MSEDQPINCCWDGESFTPVSAFWSRRADKQFVVGAKYLIEARQERSDASHRGYFAMVKEAWSNLPEDQADKFASPEHLRRWALIKAGYCNERSIVCKTPEEAAAIAAFIEPMDDFAVVMVSENIVMAFTAKSQSYRAMDKTEFQKSKDAVLDVLANLLGVSVEDLKKAEAA